jgi:hypothetical protein
VFDEGEHYLADGGIREDAELFVKELNRLLSKIEELEEMIANE